MVPLAATAQLWLLVLARQAERWVEPVPRPFPGTLVD